MATITEKALQQWVHQNWGLKVSKWLKFFFYCKKTFQPETIGENLIEKDNTLPESATQLKAAKAWGEAEEQWTETVLKILHGSIWIAYVCACKQETQAFQSYFKLL